MTWKWGSGQNKHLEEMRKKLHFLLVPPALLSLSLWAWNEEMIMRDWKSIQWDKGRHRKVAQDLEAWNILVIYLEQIKAALSDKCAGQGPTSAVEDKTPPPPLPWKCSDTGTTRARKARAGIISNLNHNLNMISLCFLSVILWLGLENLYFTTWKQPEYFLCDFQHQTP